MKLAIISVTNNGALLAEKLAHSLDEDITVFYKEGRNPVKSGYGFDSLSRLIACIFNQYDGLIFIMATGIVVRVIAPYVNDKRFDPAVVVMDEKGQFAISLLSGHIGGANELARRIASISDAQSVVTTATDTANKPAADMLAVKLGLAIEPFNNMKAINAAIANDDKVEFFIDCSLREYKTYTAQARAMAIELKNIDELTTSEYDTAVLITNRTYSLDIPHVYLRPPNLAVGIGCRRGTPLLSIRQAVEDACRQIGRSLHSIHIVGSTILKSDEKGLLDFCNKLGKPIRFFSNDEIQNCITNNNLPISRFVEKEIGVGNICEAAALLAGQTNKLLLNKTKYQGITVAIAEVN